MPTPLKTIRTIKVTFFLIREQNLYPLPNIPFLMISGKFCDVEEDGVTENVYDSWSCSLLSNVVQLSLSCIEHLYPLWTDLRIAWALPNFSPKFAITVLLRSISLAMSRWDKLCIGSSRSKLYRCPFVLDEKQKRNEWEILTRRRLEHKCRICFCFYPFCSLVLNFAQAKLCIFLEFACFVN